MQEVETWDPQSKPALTRLAVSASSGFSDNPVSGVREKSRKTMQGDGWKKGRGKGCNSILIKIYRSKI